jgi:hypothetical protein
MNAEIIALYRIARLQQRAASINTARLRVEIRRRLRQQGICPPISAPPAKSIQATNDLVRYCVQETS